jgi:hypothetical protein
MQIKAKKNKIKEKKASDFIDVLHFTVSEVSSLIPQNEHDAVHILLSCGTRYFCR